MLTYNRRFLFKFWLALCDIYFTFFSISYILMFLDSFNVISVNDNLMTKSIVQLFISSNYLSI